MARHKDRDWVRAVGCPYRSYGLRLAHGDSDIRVAAGLAERYPTKLLPDRLRRWGSAA
jgi:hypothetical protein